MKRNDIKKVVVIGSGALQIAQAGEFDYSGSQALKAMKEEGIYTVLVNPNIATIQTSEGIANKVYFVPVTPYFVEKVIQKEKPDGILVAFGGQTALNCGLQLEEMGVLEKYNVEVLGTSLGAIRTTEDRELFANKLKEINIKTAKSKAVNSVEDAVKAGNEIGYPLIIRSAFVLGGMGSGFCNNENDLRKLAEHAFSYAPQILVEESLYGWKEIEFEVIRDKNDHCFVVASMENFDPLGIHTGESIVVAPTQTLSQEEIDFMHEISVKTIREIGIVGECNIQIGFKSNIHPPCPLKKGELENTKGEYQDNAEPNSPFVRGQGGCDTEFDYRVIEVNARLSRSSALASKATGYPLAFVAAKLAIGYTLDEIGKIGTQNSAAVAPKLDYVICKIPRWDLSKFIGVSREIGSSMKSVGEIMSIGKTFEEAIQKGLRMIGQGMHGFVGNWSFKVGGKNIHPPNPLKKGELDLTINQFPLCKGAGGMNDQNSPFIRGQGDDDNSNNHAIDQALSNPTDQRIFVIEKAFDAGYTVDKIHDLTKINHWFLEKLKSIWDYSQKLSTLKTVEDITPEMMFKAKSLGFSDFQIARFVDKQADATMENSNLKIRNIRKKMNILPSVKRINTVASEHPELTNYLYTTYDGSDHDIPFYKSEKSVIILGSGPYRIGSSVEFDWCSVNAVQTARNLGYRAIMINYNPETVSTDYDVCDKLYMDELSMERVLDIFELELSKGVILSVGGQIPNNLAMKLHRQHVPILGTSPLSIDRAENRHKFSSMLDNLGIDQPQWKELTDKSDIFDFCDKVGFPVLIRPSYVLSGAAMNVCYNKKDLEHFLTLALNVSKEHPVVISKFINNAKELEFDAVARNGEIIEYAISEHIEFAGVHSGDATLVFPAQKIYFETGRRVKKISRLIAKELNISGPFNIQFMAVNNDIKVIECNLRASRSFPFVSKILKRNFIETATKIMLDVPVTVPNKTDFDIDYIGVKASQFSFSRLKNTDPILGVDMSSTGEVGCLGNDIHEALLLAMLSVGYTVPKKNIMLSTGEPKSKVELLEVCKKLIPRGFKLFATRGTQKFLEEYDVPATVVRWGDEEGENVIDMINNREFDLVINIPKDLSLDELNSDFEIRRRAIDRNIPLITNSKLATAFLDAICEKNLEDLIVQNWEEFR